jgi:hypothetical protein
MTIQQAIERANEMRMGNSSTDDVKIRWLSELDGMIYNDVIKKHKGNESIAKPEYTIEDTSKELIAEAPYDVLYVYFLMASIDLAASEINKYNSSVSLYNSVLSNYKNWYRRNHQTVDTIPIKVGGMV